MRWSSVEETEIAMVSVWEAGVSAMWRVCLTWGPKGRGIDLVSRGDRAGDINDKHTTCARGEFIYG